MMQISWNEFRSVPFFFFFWTNFRRIEINSSPRVWKNSPVKPSAPGLLVLGSFVFFLIIDSISILVIELFIFSIFGLIFGDCTFLAICPFYWHIVAHTCVYAKLLQSCPTLCNPMDCSLPDSSVHGTLQARILEWLSFPPPGISPTQESNPHPLTSLYH